MYLSIYAILASYILILSFIPQSYETGQVNLDVHVDKPKIGFFSIGDNFTTKITVTNKSNQTRYFQITELFRPDTISNSYHGDSYENDTIIEANSVLSFQHSFVVRTSDLYWLIVGANGFENSTHVGNLISNQSFTDYYIHPSSDVDIATLTQSTAEGGILTFIGTIIGGVVSGGVGFFIAWYTNKLQDKERLKDNVYRKLYGYIFDLHKRNVPNDNAISTDVWTKMEPYELIKMDQKIKSEFDAMSSDIERWNKFCNTLNSNFYHNEVKIKNILQEAFHQNNLLNANGNISIKESNYSVDGLLQMYWMIIMNPEIKDSETLSNIMIEFAQEFYSFRDEMMYLKENTPTFFAVLLQCLPDLRQMCLLDFNYSEMMMLRGKIKDQIVTLKAELEKLAK